MRFYKKEIRTAIVVLTLLLISYLFRFVQRDMPEAAMVKIVLRLMRHLIQAGLLMLWIVSLQNRILQRAVRRYLVATAALMLLWLVVRVFKWDYTATETALNRYCWYAYYISIIFIPLFGVFIVDYIGKPEEYGMNPKKKLLYIPAFALVLAVFTNDIHRLVFAFPNGIQNYDREYTYGVLYYVVLAWVIGFAAYSIIQLLLKCRVPGRRTFRCLPAVVFGAGVVFWTAYGIFRISCDITAINCLMIVALLESAIQSGLIRSNSHYTDIFRASAVSGVIVDRDYRVCYASGESRPLAKETMRKAEHGAVVSGDFRLNSAAISGGHVLWMDDISKINELTRELQSVGEQLSGKNDLLRAELELKEKQARVEEQSRIYDRITKEMTTRLDEIDLLLRQIEETPAVLKTVLPKICVISAYIKRRGNLLVLGEAESQIQAKELELCLRESADNLQLHNVITFLDADCQGTIPADYAVAVYDLFEGLLEQVLDTVNALMIHLTVSGGALSLTLGIGSSGITPPDSRALEALGGRITLYADDTDTDVRVHIPGGGARQ